MKTLDPNCPHGFTIQGYRHERGGSGAHFKAHTEMFSTAVIFTV